MKFFVVACLIVCASANQDVIKAKWSAFKAQHGKQYHAAEEATRLNNFLQATIDIEEHNARFHRGEVSYSLGHNDHSDLSHEEFKSKYLGKKSMSVEGFNFTETPASNMPSAPASVDWRGSGLVTPAKDQASCGSCYAFGTLGVVESAIAQATKTQMDLSEQQVVDCSFHIQGRMNGGCGGGHEVVVMDYVARNGLVTEGEYSYQSGRSETHYSCKRTSGGPNGKGMKYRRVAAGNERTLADAVAQYGPHVMSISGENRDFQLFRGGIYDNPRCPTQVDHVISVVGYGTEGGKDFWIVKNSWGSKWGENGFGKVRRGVNRCGVVSDHSWSIYF